MDKELDQSDLNQLVKLVTELVYYSQIHTVKGVQPANMQSHDESWREAQQWLWNNCKPIEGEYFLKTEMTTSSRVKRLENRVKELEDKIEPLIMLCEENGKPVDGFRFRELILELKHFLTNKSK